MFCPKCRAEYREGFTECSDCRVPLVAERRKGPADPDLEWVAVLETGDPVVAAAAKDLLEQAGIPLYALGDEIGARYAAIGEYIHPWRRICVGRDREGEARALLQRFEDADPNGAAPE